MSAEEGLAWGFFNKIAAEPLSSLEKAKPWPPARRSPTVTKRMLHEEWNAAVDQAIDMEAQAQAELMLTKGLPPRLRGVRRERKPFRGRLMDRFAHYEWPFFEVTHRGLAREVEKFAKESSACARRGRRCDLQALVQDRLLRLMPLRVEKPDVRSIAIARVLAYHSGLADFAFVMQGLGSGPIALAGDSSLKQQYLALAANGDAIAAFALSEPGAGSDVQAMTTRRRGGAWLLNGTKTWISNGGIADFYVVFAKAEEGISAL